MTAHIPARAARSSWSSPMVSVEQAHDDLQTARAVLDATRRRVALGEDGAAALATAEWRWNKALEKLDALGGWAPSSEPPEPDDNPDDPPPAA